MGLRDDINLLVRGKKMTNYEANMANAIHAMWDILIMHHSVESAADDYKIPITSISAAAREVIAKVKEYEYYERLKNGKRQWHGDASAVKECEYREQREIPNKRV